MTAYQQLTAYEKKLHRRAFHARRLSRIAARLATEDRQVGVVADLVNTAAHGLNRPWETISVLADVVEHLARIAANAPAQLDRPDDPRVEEIGRRLADEWLRALRHQQGADLR